MRSPLAARRAIVSPLAVSPGGSAGWWLSGGVSQANCALAYQPKGAASLAASYVNLNNPGTYDASLLSGTPVWSSAAGWQFDRSWWLTSGFNPTAGSTSMIVRFANVGGGNSFLGSTGPNFYVGPWSGADDRLYNSFGGGGSVSVIGKITGGIMAICVTAGYLNGDLDATWTAGALTGGNNIIMGALSAAGIFPSDYDVLAMAAYLVDLNATQVAAISAAMAAL